MNAFEAINVSDTFEASVERSHSRMISKPKSILPRWGRAA